MGNTRKRAVVVMASSLVAVGIILATFAPAALGQAVRQDEIEATAIPLPGMEGMPMPTRAVFFFDGLASPLQSPLVTPMP
jgi:hypothetical protein